MTGKKPPPITVAPAGFDAHRRMGDAEGRTLAPAALQHLAALPPFQSFIASRHEAPEGARSDVFAYERAAADVAEQGAEAFLAAYEAWHHATGKWPNENAYGEPL